MTSRLNCIFCALLTMLLMLLYGCSQSTSDPSQDGGIGTPLVIAPEDSKNNITFAGNTQLPNSGKMVEYEKVTLRGETIVSDIDLTGYIEICHNNDDRPIIYHQLNDASGNPMEAMLENFINYGGDFNIIKVTANTGFFEGKLVSLHLQGSALKATCDVKQFVEDEWKKVLLRCTITGGERDPNYEEKCSQILRQKITP